MHTNNPHHRIEQGSGLGGRHAAAVFAFLCLPLFAGAQSLLAPGAEVEKLHGGFTFIEGPAADSKGNVYFTDIPNSRIHVWSAEGQLSTFAENSGRANGLIFDSAGNLFACEMENGRITSRDPEGKVTVLADKYEGEPFNSPNDLWIAPGGGVYFTDPNYTRGRELPQAGEHVYYISPDRKSVRRVVSDLVRPNGVIGTRDGKTLYVADHGGGKTYAYAIGDDGSLSGKKLFAPQGSDGVALDELGNLYLTGSNIAVYDPTGKKIEEIDVPEGPANVTFGGPGGKTLFITARTSLYAVRMRVSGN